MPIVFLILGVPIALAVWLIVRAVSAKNRIEELSRRLHILEAEVIRLKRDKESAPKTEPSRPRRRLQPKIITAGCRCRRKPVIIPPLPPPVAALPAGFRPDHIPPRSAPANPATKTDPAINWEQFMGVKLFAWLGGLRAVSRCGVLHQIFVRQQSGFARTACRDGFHHRTWPARRWRDDVTEKLFRALANFLCDGRRHSLCHHVCVLRTLPLRILRAAPDVFADGAHHDHGFLSGRPAQRPGRRHPRNVGRFSHADSALDRPGQSAWPLRLHRHPRRRIDRGRAASALVFPDGAGGDWNCRHANRLGWKNFS